MTEQKKPKRIRQKVIQVVVTEAEKKQIEENAECCSGKFISFSIFA
jgi:hypothetical protein